jgi:RHH-type proline utilization regulon transcriptional repressor/proline dehydrogenase/delta 1-pyrroline-5-carboxylate dehydrogenase
MGWSMGDEAVKVQLFRFIDALPNLKSPEDVSTHLRDYFRQANGSLPAWVRRTAGLLPADGVGGRLLAWAADVNARRMARRFIAGSNVEEALGAIAAMRRRNLAFTIDLLGEATITEPEAEQYQRQYLELIEGLSRDVNDWPAVPLIDSDHAGPLPRVNVSVKLTSLYSQFDPIAPEATSEAVRRRLRPILRLARRHRAFVNFDMEQYAFKAITLRIFEEVLTEDEFRDSTSASPSRRTCGTRPTTSHACGTGPRPAARPSGSGWSRGRTGTTRRSSPSRTAGCRRSGRKNGRPTPATRR